MENYYKRKRDDSVEAAEGTSVPEPEPEPLVLVEVERILVYILFYFRVLNLNRCSTMVLCEHIIHIISIYLYVAVLY